MATIPSPSYLRIKEREWRDWRAGSGLLCEPCGALAPVFKTGGPASPFGRSRSCFELRALGGPLRKLFERHLANHELPRGDLLSHVFELRLVPFPIPLKSRLCHLQSVGLQTPRSELVSSPTPVIPRD